MPVAQLELGIAKVKVRVVDFRSSLNPKPTLEPETLECRKRLVFRACKVFFLRFSARTFEAV